VGERQTKGDNRVLRGGSWINDGGNLRSANRNANAPGNRNANIGLRPAQLKEMPDGIV
jgi:formylglycine-generating enzyme required for sulfatase activity